MMRLASLPVAALLVSAAFFGASNRCAATTFAIEATVDSVFDPDSRLGGVVQPGGVILGTLEYDPFALTESTPSSFFDNSNFFNRLTLQTGGAELFDTNDGATIDFFAPSLNLFFIGDTSPSTANDPGIGDVEAVISLQDLDGVPGFAASLPETLTLEGLELATLSLRGTGPNFSTFVYSIRATITSIRPVPEPGSFALLCFAGSLGFGRRRVQA